jgi:hypothetical protein
MPLDFGTLDWTAEVRPLYDAQGREIPPGVVRGVYRSDTDQCIASCGADFKPVQHQDVLDPMLQTLKDQGYDIVERSTPDQRSLYDLKGQRGAFASFATQDDGAIMRADIIVGDFIDLAKVTGHGYLGRDSDVMLRRFTALNSHDGTYAVRTTNGYFRVLCLNGLMDPTFTASSYGKHTLGFNVEALKANILRAATLMETDAEKFGLYARTRLSMKQAEEYLKGTLAKLPDTPTGEEAWSKPLVEDILRRFKDEDATVWGLMNAMTNWATHGDLRANAGAITARTGRDERVARAMRAPLFKQLLVQAA